jgi:hypothetical protein
VITVLEPTGSRRTTPTARRTARRTGTLDGAIVGLVVNGLGESEALLEDIYAELAKRAAVSDVVRVRKPGLSVPPTPQDWDRLTREATVAVVGFGGCGSCSSRALRDAMELEWAGIPSAAIVHGAMTPTLRAMARLSGMPDYPYAVVEHPHLPIARWDPDETKLIAKSVVDRVYELLTTDVTGQP